MESLAVVKAINQTVLALFYRIFRVLFCFFPLGHHVLIRHSLWEILSLMAWKHYWDGENFLWTNVTFTLYWPHPLMMNKWTKPHYRKVCCRKIDCCLINASCIELYLCTFCWFFFPCAISVKHLFLVVRGVVWQNSVPVEYCFFLTLVYSFMF